MVKKSTRKTAAKKIAQPSISAKVESANLKSYIWYDAEGEGFTFTRYWWDGDGPREGITPWVRQKMWPGEDPKFGAAAKVEVLLPPTAPADYASAEFLLRRFDETLPPYERHAMVQAKIVLDAAEPWHVGYERARTYARSHFAARFPTILVAHVPGVAGLEGYGNHVHCIVLSRALGINGLGGADHQLCSDRGYADALSAWQASLAREEERP